MSRTVEFSLPDVGEGIAEAELIQWLVAVGDTIAEDDAIAIIETDKSQIELPAPISGTVTTIGPAEGDVVPVGGLLLTIVAEGTDAAGISVGPPVRESLGQPDSPADATAADVVDVPAPTSEARRPGSDRPLASPSTRRLARQRGIDLSAVTGTGPHGRITSANLDNVNAAVAGMDKSESTHLTIPTPAKGSHRAPHRQPEDKVIKLHGLRRQISRSMTEALKIPHINELREIDATELLAAHALLKERFNRDGMRLSVLPILVKACVWALARHPSFNARFDVENEQVTQFGSVQFGIATSTNDGLIVPVIHDCEQLSLREIAQEIDRLANASRARTVAPEDLKNGTFTLTNFGSFGAWLGMPIIHPPEVAITGFGRIGDKVIAIEGQPVVRPVLPIVVSTDHRINDGADLGGFVADLAAALTQPLLLLDEA